MAKTKRFSQDEFITQLNQLIENSIAVNVALFNVEKVDVRIEHLAATFRVNVATLRRWCVEYTGYSPKKYLDNYRIEKAKQLLRQGMRSGEIAQQLGYTEHKVFCSVFKRVS